MADVLVGFTGEEDGEDYKDGPFYLTNGGGWHLVCEWAEGAEDYPHLQQLVRDGQLEDTVALGLDLAGACVTAPAKVRGVLERLAEMVGVGDEGETAAIVGDVG